VTALGAAADSSCPCLGGEGLRELKSSAQQLRLHPGITQEVAPNESPKSPKATAREALISEAFFVVRWLSC